jgi:hypothetical protein
LNKFIRKFSEEFARHTSLEANIADVFNRCIMRSDPVILSYRRQKSCSRCEVQDDHFTISCPTKKVTQMTCPSLYDEMDRQVESYLFSD